MDAAYDGMMGCGWMCVGKRPVPLRERGWERDENRYTQHGELGPGRRRNVAEWRMTVKGLDDYAVLACSLLRGVCLLTYLLAQLCARVLRMVQPPVYISPAPTAG